MDEADLITYITTAFADVETSSAFGYEFFFCGADRKMPFATLISKDNEHDRVSNLDRGSLYRLNIGVSRETYRSLFGVQPAAPGSSGVVDAGHDFTAVDQILPHPVYTPQSWVCVISPGEATWARVRVLLAEAWEIADRRRVRREAAG